MTAADNPIGDFLHATEHDDSARAAALLNRDPAIARANVFTAAAAGDEDALAGFLARDPSLLDATHGPEQFPPLAYVCRSPLHAGDADRAARLRRAAEMLLDRGASPNSFSVYWESAGKSVPISVLYHACMSDHVALVELLLERGAATQDGESIYHAAQHNRRACLERLLAHGADLSSRQSPYGNTPLYFLCGHQDDEQGRAAWFQGLVWLLEHGADPNVTSGASRDAPLHKTAANPRLIAASRALILHGADVNLPGGDGRRPYQIAVRSGNVDAAAVFREHGADLSLEPADEWAAACLAGDADTARRLLAREAGLRASLPGLAESVVGSAIRLNRPAAVRLMVEFGFDLAREPEHGGTALHWAAWLGRVELVRLLIDLGSPIDVRDRQYGASALGWAAHGSECHHADDRYCAIVDALADAGARRECTINKWGQALTGTPRVAQRLKDRGLG